MSSDEAAVQSSSSPPPSAPIAAAAAAPSVPTSLAQACDNTSSLGGGAHSNFGTVESVRIYLQRNAPGGAGDITSFRDGEGRTALHWAVSFKNFELANALLYGPYKEEALVLMKGDVRKKKKKKNENGRADAAAVAADDDENKNEKETEEEEEEEEAAGFCAGWALPPDASGTTVLTTACAVGAAPNFVQDLISIATGLPAPQVGSAADPGSIVLPPSTASSSSSATDSAVATAVAEQKQVKDAMHPLFDAQDTGGNKALHIAASRGNMKLLTLLLAYGTDARSTNKRNQTCLHRLIGRGDISGVENLIHFARKKFPLAAKSFVNACDANGDTALHYASMEENREMGELLLRNGANRDLRNKQGKEFWQL